MKVEFTVEMKIVGFESMRVFEVDDEDVKGLTDEEIDDVIIDQYYPDWIYDLAFPSHKVIKGSTE